MSGKTWRFHALDTWFFRESRPMETIGGSELASVFPPPVRTVAGAIRTAIGEHQGVEWKKFPNDPKYAKLREHIGVGDSMGFLSLKGTWLSCKINGKRERLYPVPLNLMGRWEQGKLQKVVRIHVGKPIYCDLGRNVRMAVVPNGERDISSLKDYWITESSLEKHLSGEQLESSDIITAKDLYQEESRLGIARDNKARVVEKERLYQTRHIRPHNDVVVEVDIEGLNGNDIPQSGVVRFGGEGRAAAFKVEEKSDKNFGPAKITDDIHGVTFTLLTPACVVQENAQPRQFTPLPGFTKEEKDGETVWCGEIMGKAFTLHCAITGKVQREGGWDLVKSAPRTVTSFIPAGSVFYCTVDDSDIEGALTLQKKQLRSSEQILGRGVLAIGLWRKNELIT